MEMINPYAQSFEAYRTAHPFAGQPSELYEPVNYIMALGGKRLRPVLTMLGYELFQPASPAVLPLAYAVEIFHNFTLVHDDIMDAAPLRRGQATVHTKWNVNTGILSGDVMLIAAYDYLARAAPPAHLPALLAAFNRVAREVCEGQQMDMNFEQENSVTIAAYLRMIELKTAVLIGGALELAALAAGAAPADVAHLEAFGRYSGIAFQLQDDLLDAFGDPDKVGKQVGGDIVQNKKTYLILRALELAPPAERAELLQFMTTPSPADPSAKVARVTALLRSLGIPEQAEAVKTSFQDRAFEHLAQVNGLPAAKQRLEALTLALLGREA